MDKGAVQMCLHADVVKEGLYKVKKIVLHVQSYKRFWLWSKFYKHFLTKDVSFSRQVDPCFSKSYIQLFHFAVL